MASSSLSRYSTFGHKHVDGWLDELAIAAIIRLSKAQADRNVSGGACEVGVHHGRLFILLHLLTKGNERTVAYDLFENQEENVDKSGLGSRGSLLRNLDKHGCDSSRIKLVTVNSLTLNAGQVVSDCESRPRLFSIDGGHTPKITRSDLCLAAQAICQGGLVILDDFFNESWPGVAEGTCRAFFDGSVTLIPVVIVGNKFIFTNDLAAAQAYQRALEDLGDKMLISMSAVFDKSVVVLTDKEVNLRTKLARTVIWRAVRDTRIGSVVRSIANRQ